MYTTCSPCVRHVFTVAKAHLLLEECGDAAGVRRDACVTIMYPLQYDPSVMSQPSVIIGPCRHSNWEEFQGSDGCTPPDLSGLGGEVNHIPFHQFLKCEDSKKCRLLLFLLDKKATLLYTSFDIVPLAVKKRRILSLKFPPGGSANSIECFAV